MNGEYLRITPAELLSAIKDPEWVWAHADEIIDREDESEPLPAEARHLTTHKAWHAIDFLLHRAAFPVDIVIGEEEFTDEDWGYGPPRYLTPEQVNLAAEALSGASYDELIQGLDPAELTAAEIYPEIWDSPEELQWVRGWYEPILPFFTAAAKDGDAMLLWIS
jgi:hypothetical protein